MIYFTEYEKGKGKPQKSSNGLIKIDMTCSFKGKLVRRNSSFKFIISSAKFIVEYLGYHSQRVGFQVLKLT